MTNLENKIDFAVVVSVKNANPNGDPLNGNRPRENYDGCGEISDVCLKRTIRNRMQDMGQPVFVKSDDRSDDGFKSLKERADACKPFADAVKKKDAEKAKAIACSEWLDVRSFGQLFAFKGDDASIGIRGPVSIHPAFSVDTIDVTATQITKSVNSVPGTKKASDTMGMKYRVDFGMYVFTGASTASSRKRPDFQQRMQRASVRLSPPYSRTTVHRPARKAVWRCARCSGGSIIPRTGSTLQRRSTGHCMCSRRQIRRSPSRTTRLH